MAVGLAVLTERGEDPATVTPFGVLYRTVPVQLLVSESVKYAFPSRRPPAEALMVAESLGTHVCAVVIDEATLLTTTSSLASLHASLCEVALVFGELPV